MSFRPCSSSIYVIPSPLAPLNLLWTPDLTVFLTSMDMYISVSGTHSSIFSFCKCSQTCNLSFHARHSSALKIGGFLFFFFFFPLYGSQLEPAGHLRIGEINIFSFSSRVLCHIIKQLARAIIKKSYSLLVSLDTSVLTTGGIMEILTGHMQTEVFENHLQ